MSKEKRKKKQKTKAKKNKNKNTTKNNTKMYADAVRQDYTQTKYKTYTHPVSAKYMLATSATQER